MADFVKYLVTVDPESGEIVRAERLGSAGELSEVPADAFTWDAARAAEPVEKEGYSATDAESSDDPKAIGPKGPGAIGPKAIGPKGTEAIGPKGPGTVGPKAIGPKGIESPDPEESKGEGEAESPEGDDRD